MPSPRTICGHEGSGQTLVPGAPTTCRRCGAQIEPQQVIGTPPAASSTVQPSMLLDASYPAEPRKGGH